MLVKKNISFAQTFVAKKTIQHFLVQAPEAPAGQVTKYPPKHNVLDGGHLAV